MGRSVTLVAVISLALVCVAALVLCLVGGFVQPLPNQYGTGILSYKNLLKSLNKASRTAEEEDAASEELIAVNLNMDKWGYSMKDGPSLWGSMFPRGSMPVGGCNGNWQSPIRVDSSAKNTIIDTKHNLAINYPEVTGWVMKRERNRLFMQRNPAMGMGRVAYRGRSYSVRRVEFHYPAQHSVNGEQYGMELDIIHTDDDGRMLNVAVMIKANAEKEYLHNQALNSHLNIHALPSSDGDVVNLADTFSLACLMNNRNLTYFSYIGSEDTPPCIEGVQWIVMASPQWMNHADMDYYPADLRGNSRTLQALNGRKVYISNKVTGPGLSYDKGLIGGSRQASVGASG